MQKRIWELEENSIKMAYYSPDLVIPSPSYVHTENSQVIQVLLSLHNL